MTLTFDLNDSKINRVLPLPQGNYVAKFAKDQIYRTKVIMWKRPLSKIIFIVTVTLTFDLMTPTYIGFLPFHRGISWPSLVKIRYTELKLLCGNLCGRPPARHTQSHNMAQSQDRCIQNGVKTQYFSKGYVKLNLFIQK